LFRGAITTKELDWSEGQARLCCKPQVDQSPPLQVCGGGLAQDLAREGLIIDSGRGDGRTDT
jgi:hypothetical protein